MNVTLRKAVAEDAVHLLDIYTHYIQNTVATFHEFTKTLEAYRQQIIELSAVYPFWVAEAEGRFLGFANAEPFRPQSGYRYTVELTIYLHPDAPKHAGIGRMLYKQVLDDLKAQGFVTALGCISGENEASIAFHRSFGFKEMAVFPRVAFKHGRWLNAIWMRKELLPTDTPPAEPVRADQR
ncbi:MAG: N-acetyltransferase [Clostridiales bacterium]|nr:N-acetyltransferase [Clostridiales bacterium]